MSDVVDVERITDGLSESRDAAALVGRADDAEVCDAARPVLRP